MQALLFLFAGVLAAAQTPALPVGGQVGVNSAVRPDVMPRVIYKCEPEYSEEARIARMQGTALVHVLVDTAGIPRDLRVVRTLGLGLDEKALEAARCWRFSPGKREGSPVPVEATIEMNFRFSQDSGSWRSTGADFKIPGGGSRPRVVMASYPNPAGADEKASVTPSFDIDEDGEPRNVRVEKSSDPKWEAEMVWRVSQGWLFQAATKDGKPIVVPA